MSSPSPSPEPTPSAPASAAPELDALIDWTCIEHHLQKLVAQNRDKMFEPWRALVGSAPSLSSEVDRTVQDLRVFMNKWVIEIIVVLAQNDRLRFTGLKRALDGISGRTLSQRLDGLEAQGILKRTMFDEMPVRVEYSLTKKGMDIAMLALPLVVYLRAQDRARATP